MQLPVVKRHVALYRFIARASSWPLRIALTTVIVLFRLPRDARARVLALHGDYVLLVKNIGDTSSWTLPGGGAKKNESLKDAAKRELYEELHIDAGGALAPLGYFKKQQLGTPFDKDCYFLDMKKVDEPRMRLSLELIDAIWVPVADLPKDTSKVVSMALDALAKKRR